MCCGWGWLGWNLSSVRRDTKTVPNSTFSKKCFNVKLRQCQNTQCRNFIKIVQQLWPGELIKDFKMDFLIWLIRNSGLFRPMTIYIKSLSIGPLFASLGGLQPSKCGENEIHLLKFPIFFFIK